jgi:GT2 family glycosyltransferase
MHPIDFLQKIFFVIVLYKKKPEESPALQTILELTKDISTAPAILLYDNSPVPGSVVNENVIYYHDPKNSGVAKAYNRAALLAGNLHKTWMLLIDQDMALPVDFFQKLLPYVQRNKETVAFVPQLLDYKGLVSPFKWSLGKGKRIAMKQPVLQFRRFRFANSGALISLDAFNRVGGYEESIPLDFSDIAFGEKLMRITDHFIVTDIVLRHSFSGSADNSFGEELERFKIFWQGSINMGKVFGSSRMLRVQTFLRMAKLSYHHKRFEFIMFFLVHRNND